MKSDDQNGFSPAQWSIALLSLAGLTIGVFFATYGDPRIMGYTDALFPEAFYRDIVLDNGNLGAWGFNMPSYWLDNALYFLVRFIFGDIHNGMAAYAAVQCLLIATGAFYSCAFLARSASESLISLVFSALLVSLLCLYPASFQIMRMPAMHGLTLVCFLFCVGLLLRLLGDSKNVRLALGVSIFAAAASMSDGLFTMWFTLPAVGCILLLLVAKRIEKKLGIRFLALFLFCFILGRVADGFFRPNIAEYSPVHPSITKMLQKTPDLLQNIFSTITYSPVTTWLYLLAFGAFIFLVLRKEYLFCGTLSALYCIAFSGVIINGRTEVSYVNQIIISFPLLTIPPLFFAFSSKKNTILSYAAALFLVCFATANIMWKKPSYYPPLAACLDEAAKRTRIDNVASAFWIGRPATLFSHAQPSLDMFHHRNFTLSLNLNNEKPKEKQAYQAILLDTHDADFLDFEKMRL